MGSLSGSGRKTTLRVVRCRLKCRQSGLIYLTRFASLQQAGSSSAATAAGQWTAVSAVSPALAVKLPLFFQLLLQPYEDVVNPSNVLPQTSHGVDHHLETRGPLVTLLFRRLDAQKLAAAKAEFAAF